MTSAAAGTMGSNAVDKLNSKMQRQTGKRNALPLDFLLSRMPPIFRMFFPFELTLLRKLLTGVPSDFSLS